MTDTQAGSLESRHPREKVPTTLARNGRRQADSPVRSTSARAQPWGFAVGISEPGGKAWTQLLCNPSLSPRLASSTTRRRADTGPGSWVLELLALQ
ncbi:hypothetical protein GGTG_05673 [Gaeumannomyces tritici R3-111a-1]|uniref:Uncharacterized protein n=1 Tax=Gaeumannomyces tritici (strain R3-111a-1) TaxID=644352 RepID=J3NWL0_GAET3|nr:hypothetical protein GGTG_05673 [Gaeumannomyces tritici R3-111a-1]EJT75742.1 hypothetical protein GGTG_05673 [Gaeumannomyces tritici R3-111a-1]